ncbi:MAG: hypothetical protein DRR15_14940 [Gammaproteobacteria bacterium]|nr:MAG: hypothetical protein DRR15_14940 [Gammaproteobacteria bacterium]
MITRIQTQTTASILCKLTGKFGNEAIGGGISVPNKWGRPAIFLAKKMVGRAGFEPAINWLKAG